MEFLAFSSQLPEQYLQQARTASFQINPNSSIEHLALDAIECTYWESCKVTPPPIQCVYYECEWLELNLYSSVRLHSSSACRLLLVSCSSTVMMEAIYSCETCDCLVTTQPQTLKQRILLADIASTAETPQRHVCLSKSVKYFGAADLQLFLLQVYGIQWSPGLRHGRLEWRAS